MSFQDNLKKYREIAGYTQAKDFAEKIGVPYQTYMGYENRGREPKFDTLMKIAAALHVSIDELIGHTLNTPHNLKNAIDTFQQYGFTVEKGVKDYSGVTKEVVFQVTDSKYNNTTSVFSPGDLIKILDKATENKYYRQRKADLFHETIASELTNYFNHREWPKDETIATVERMFQNKLINEEEKATLLQEIEKNKIHNNMDMFAAFCRLPGKAYDGE